MKKPGWLAIALIAVCASWAQTAHKYDIKSGIVNLESVSTVMGTQIKMTMIVYFDDYGMKECQETYTNGTLQKVLFSDGKNKISLKLKSKKATNLGPTDRGVCLRVDINDFGTKKDIESGLVKKLAPMTIDGQSCEVLQVNRQGADTPDLYAGWHQVMVYMKSAGSGVNSVIKAVKLQADAVVPKEKFQVPDGFTVQ
jgi:hypothetical protein